MSFEYFHEMKNTFRTDFLNSTFLPSPGSFLLCFLLCFSPSVPRILDYWVRYKLWMAMTYQASIWLPRFHGISSVLKHCLIAWRGKYESIDYWSWYISLLNPTMKCVKLFSSGACSPHWEHMILSVSAIPLSTQCSLSSLWCWTKMLSQKLPCYIQSYTKICWRYLTVVHVLNVTVQPHIINKIHMKNTMFFFFPQGRPLSFKTFLIWVLISIYQGK